jgi:predicted acylesterase/phospholipase RssA
LKSSGGKFRVPVSSKVQSARFCGRHGRTVVGPTWTFRRHSFLFQAMTHVFSPYQINPFNLNPLKSVLSEVVDFDRLAKCKMAPRLFLSATNARTGKVKVFENDAMSVEVVLASACLPYVFHAVEIDGEDYWDGGFMGNPVIFPLIYNRGFQRRDPGPYQSDRAEEAA